MQPDITINRRMQGGSTARKCWPLQSGVLGTVEELALEYYMAERGYAHGVVDSSCLYGGLYWVVFHDIIFHDNLNSAHPLRADFYHQGRLGYERFRDKIEQRLTEFKQDRKGIFEKSFLKFTNIPLFTDPRSKIKSWCGSWVKQHVNEMRLFLEKAPEHDLEALLRELITESIKGHNSGWPDLVSWNDKDLLFVEVKWRDEVSEAQGRWIQSHRDRYCVEVLRVCAASSGILPSYPISPTT